MVEHLPSMLEALGVSFVQLYALSPAEVAESPASLKDKLNMEERQQRRFWSCGKVSSAGSITG